MLHYSEFKQGAADCSTPAGIVVPPGQASTKRAIRHQDHGNPDVEESQEPAFFRVHLWVLSGTRFRSREKN